MNEDVRIVRLKILGCQKYFSITLKKEGGFGYSYTNSCYFKDHFSSRCLRYTTLGFIFRVENLFRKKKDYKKKAFVWV